MKKNLIILAAGKGERLQPLTNDLPKCMTPLAGKNLLEWQLAVAEAVGFTKENIFIVGGHKFEKIPHDRGTVVLNPRYAETNMVQSLWCARKHFGSSIIVSYGDIVFTPEVFNKVVASRSEIGVVVDHDWHPYWQQRFDDVCSDAETLKLTSDGKIIEIGQKPKDLGDIHGQYTGLMIFNDNGLTAFCELYEKELQAQTAGITGICELRKLDDLYMTDMLQGLIEEDTEIREIQVHGGWLEIDTISDLHLAEAYCRSASGLLQINRNYDR